MSSSNLLSPPTDQSQADARAQAQAEAMEAFRQSHPQISSIFTALNRSSGAGCSKKAQRLTRQLCTMMVACLLQGLLVAYGLGIALVYSDTFVPLTVQPTTGPSGVSTYTAAGNGTSSFSAFRYVEMQPFTNTTSAGEGTNATVASTALYQQQDFGFSCHYTVYSRIDSMRTEWSSDLDGSWAYRWSGVSGASETLTIPACGLLTAYSVALILLCLGAVWEMLPSICVRICLGLGEDLELHEKSARWLSILYTLAVVFNVLAVVCCLIVVATLWMWIGATQLPNQSTQGNTIAITVMAAVIIAIYCIDTPLNYRTLQGMLVRAREQGKNVSTSPVRCLPLLCCYKESERQVSSDYTGL